MSEEKGQYDVDTEEVDKAKKDREAFEKAMAELVIQSEDIKDDIQKRMDKILKKLKAKEKKAKEKKRTQNAIEAMKGYQFQPIGEVPLSAQLNLRLTDEDLDKLKTIPNFHNKIRGVVKELISRELG